jgi:hypothetical protein
MQIDQKLIYNQEKMTLLLHTTVSTESMQNIKKYAIHYRLIPKTEFHITIIGYAIGKKIQEIFSQKNEEEIRDVGKKIQIIANSFTWQYMILPENFYLTKTYGSGEVRQSIIALVDLPDLKPFYGELESLFGCSFTVPFPHVTIFTQSTESENIHSGIGIYSIEEFNTLSPKKLV